MTREEAKAFKWFNSDREEINNHIDKIYDDFENKSCDGCKHNEQNDTYPTICWECSRYYADRYEPKDKQ